MSKYIILYEYYSIRLGCECCSDSSSEITIYKSENGNELYESHFECPLMESEEDLREYIHKVDSQYDGFDIHPNTQWF